MDESASLEKEEQDLPVLPAGDFQEYVSVAAYYIYLDRKKRGLPDDPGLDWYLGEMQIDESFLAS